MTTRRLLALVVLAAAGCAPYEARERPRPDTPVPGTFANADANGERRAELWWTELRSVELDGLVAEALADGLDVRQAWSRLEQAEAVARIDGAPLLPSFDVGLNPSYTYTENSAGFGGAFGGTFVNNVTSYGLSGTLTYEVDLWRRIASRRDASALDAAAARFEVEATALTLTGAVVETWLDLVAQRALDDVVRRQIETSRTLLDLIETRFGQGLGSSIDVLQQRQQIEAVMAELPTIASNAAVAAHRLDVLRGRVPRGARDTAARMLPSLPPFPDLGAPGDLFGLRPDLRAARATLEAADHRLASAVADRLPRLTISASYEIGGQRGAGLLSREAGSILAGLLAPLFDGGRRTAEVDRNAAVVRERAEAYAAVWLNALQEAEDALARERAQVELLASLDRQIELARRTLEEARSRHANGQNDYLTVITAVQTLQSLERRRVVEQRTLLSARSLLYRALGGRWTRLLEPTDAEERTSPGLWENRS